MALPRFVQSRTNRDGSKSYRFNPAQRLVDEGIVERVELGTDLRTAKAQARDLNKTIDDWREKQAEIIVIHKSSTLELLVQSYYKSNDFNMLREETKQDYRYFLSVLLHDLGHRPFQSVSTKQAKHVYEEWVKRGIQFANHVCTCASRVYRYALDMEYATVNPFATVRRKTPKQRKVVWQESDMKTFLDTCYSEFAYRNIGLIVHMAYEWCQRLGDIRLLEWDNLDFEQKKLFLEQSKRRAQVTLPISDNLLEMLQQQHNDFGFQRYVAPRPKPVEGLYHPYSMERLSKAGRAVMRQCGLSDELRLMDLRRTGTTEMVEAGVGIGQIMSVTGHSNPQSVKPYMKNTFTSANYALTTRKMHDISTYKCHRGE
jgi:integrase